MNRACALNLQMVGHGGTVLPYCYAGILPAAEVKRELEDPGLTSVTDPFSRHVQGFRMQDMTTTVSLPLALTNNGQLWSAHVS